MIRVGWAYWAHDRWHLCADEPVAHEPRRPVYLVEKAVDVAVSTRGLRYPAPVPTVDGTEVAVYDSSAANRPGPDAVWLSVEGDLVVRSESAGRTKVYVHLEQRDAVALLDSLAHLVMGGV